MNSVGIANSAGVGDLISDWIIDGDVKENILPLDCRRFVDLHNNRKFLRDRVKEIPGMFFRRGRLIFEKISSDSVRNWKYD